MGDNGVGGLVGLNFGTIKNTYATGIAEANARIGGLVGENGGLISDSYAVADIVCTGVSVCETYASDAGGLIGRNLGGDAINSYWDIEVSVRESAGGLSARRANSCSLEAINPQTQAECITDGILPIGILAHPSNIRFSNILLALRVFAPVVREGQPNCGTLQSYGLVNLAIAEVAMTFSELQYREIALSSRV